MRLVGLLTFIFVLTPSAATETVWLRELNADNDKRGMAGVPLELEIKHASGKTRLNLEENKRVNPNAPVFKVFEEPGTGKQMLVQQTGTPKLRTRFFQDKDNSGSFMLEYNEHQKRNLVSGVFRRGEQFYRLTPAPTLNSPTSKLDMAIRGVPYLLDEETASVGRRTTDDAAKAVYDAKKTSGKRQTIDELLEEIRSLLGEKRVQRIEKKLARKKRSNYVYAVELVLAVDHTVWRTFYERSVASGSLNQTEVTKENIRQHFVHIVNGMSLRYESIEDPAMNIYLTISGFIFYETRDSTNPLPLSTNIININGTELVSANTYLDALVPWAENLDGLQHNDHILMFTNYDLYSGTTDKDGRSTAGLAWVGGVCGSTRMSINEVGAYFETVSVTAHELGHNLGAEHDGDESASACGADTKYVMAPGVASFNQESKYTPNPWTFSACSVAQFKAQMTKLGSSNCLLDNGDYYDKVAYEAHAQLLPGQLHTADQQCQLERGPSSKLCTSLTSPTSDNFCHVMSCKEPSDGYCYFYVPARGTDCGDTGDKYCIDGQCVTKDSKYLPDAKDGADNAITTTKAPATTSTQAASCVDSGYEGDSCSYVFDWFKNNDVSPQEVCRDPDWDDRCCATCKDAKDGADNVITTTKAPATTSTQAASCVDSGYHGDSCSYVFDWFKNNDVSPQEVCRDPDWDDRCCATCKAVADSVTPAPTSSGDCTDIGYTDDGWTWTCPEIADYFKTYQNADPADWCRDPNWKANCCALCAANGV